MARKRIISPEIWRDGRVISISNSSLVVWFGCITMADDEGIIEPNPDSWYFEFGRKEFTPDIIKDCLEEIIKAGMIVPYHRYAFLPKWFKHQSLSHPTQTKLMRPPRELVMKYPSYIEAWIKTFTQAVKDPSDPDGKRKVMRVPEYPYNDELNGLYSLDASGIFQNTPEVSGKIQKAPESSGNAKAKSPVSPPKKLQNYHSDAIRNPPENSRALQKVPGNIIESKLKESNIIPDASFPEFSGEPTQETLPSDSSPFGPDDTSPTSWPHDDSDSTPEPQQDSDIPDDEPTPAQKIELARLYWQEKKITPECRLSVIQWPPAKSHEAINGITPFKLNEVKDAMNNIKIIQSNKDSYNQFEYSCETFLAKGIARYLTSANPLTTFLKPGAKKPSTTSRLCKYCGEPAESEYRMFTCEKCGYNQVEDIEIFKVRMFGTQEEKEKFFAKPEEISAMAAEMRKKLGG